LYLSILSLGQGTQTLKRQIDSIEFNKQWERVPKYIGNYTYVLNEKCEITMSSLLPLHILEEHVCHLIPV
jgi:hypothetical protein